MTMKRILLLFLLFCGGYVHAQELDSVRIYYRQGHREVDVLFRDNRAELERFIRILREEYGANRLEGVVVRSWSSPEGVNHLNEVLSDRRADSLKTYLVRHAEIPDNLVCIHGEGIAWDMLRRMVAASDMLYKKEVLHILDHTPVWVFDKAGRVVDGRKKQLMDLRGGMPYTYMLENFFPDLRSSLSVVCYRKPEPPVKVIPQKESEVKEPEPVLQPDSVAETTSEPATVRQEATVQPQRAMVQRLAIKTNLLYDAILMPSLEVEYRIADRWTVNLEGEMAWWKNDSEYLHPEVSYSHQKSGSQPAYCQSPILLNAPFPAVLFLLQSKPAACLFSFSVRRLIWKTILFSCPAYLRRSPASWILPDCPVSPA